MPGRTASKSVTNMHIYNPENKRDAIICMKRDEFLQLVSEGVAIFKGRAASTGLPYFMDDVTGNYFNFSILSDVEYDEALKIARKKIEKAEK